jgi:hypothetical protein
MDKLRKIYEDNYLNKYNFLGTCVNSFDTDGESLIPQFTDTSDFAYQEENSKKISKETFIKNVYDFSMIPKNKEVIFMITQNKNIIMAYDPVTDIHYFFGK